MASRGTAFAAGATAVVLGVAALIGCTSGETGTSRVLPPAGAFFDYQLGGAYPPQAGVRVVARDRTAPPAEGLYNICYINAFQTQPGELDLWPGGLLFHDAAGELIRDTDWPDEVIVDTRRAEDVATTVIPWIRGCADAGFDAVEFDNLDTYTRTAGALTRDDNLALATLLVASAHDLGLASGQKNAAEDAELLRTRAGFDFAVAEECVAYDECDAYLDVYGDHVIAIEYPDTLTTPWEDVCADAARPRSIVLRDRALTAAGEAGHLFAECP